MSAGWIVLVCVMGAGLFSCLHIALVDLARAVLEDIAAMRNKPAVTRRIELILADTSGHARACALVRAVLDAGTVAAMVAWVTQIRGGYDTGGDGLIFRDALIGAPIAAVLVWVFGVALPMSIAWHVGERLIYGYAWMIRSLYLVLAPLRPVARFIDEVIRRLAGVQGDTQSEVLEQELLSVVQEGEREGQFDEAERDMIEAVVEFRNLTVKQVMTPRTEIEALELTNNLGDVTRVIREIGHSRIPVYEGSLDNVVGVFYVKDLMKWLAGGGAGAAPGGFTLRSILRPAFFVPETKTVRELMQELLAKKVHIAMVADEYGGTSGLVTIEDIVEEIVGEIRDEYEEVEEQKPQVEVKPDDRTATVDARAYIDDVNDALTVLGWAVPESEDYDTVGGFVITTLGRIPEQGETFRHDRAVVTVLEASPTRVLKVRLEVKPIAEDEAIEEAPEEGGDQESER